MSKPILNTILMSPRLPSLPAVAVQVLELTRRASVNLDQVAQVIRNDQALSIKVLRTVNSSYYGLSKPCDSIKQAIVYLGINTVKTLVLGFSLVESIHGSEGNDITFDFVAYWRRSLLAAIGSREIAKHARGADPEAAFLAALMQDLGMVAMYRALSDKYLQAIDMAGGDHRKLSEIEMRAFEVTHATVGAEIAAKWKLPEQFVHVIRCHHDEANPAQPDASPLIRAVQTANIAAAALTDPNPDAALARFNRETADWLGFDAEKAKQLMTAMADAAKELATLFRVDIGAKPDVQALLDQAEDQFTDLQAQIAATQTAASHPHVPSFSGAIPRSVFDMQITRQFDQAAAASGRLALILCEVDQFKAFNDQHGGELADQLLHEVAHRLSDGMDSAALYAMGDDSFAILIPSADRVAATRIAQTLRQTLATGPCIVPKPNGETIKVTITLSLGIAALEDPSRGTVSSASQLIAAADQAVAAAKAAGRNCVRVSGAHARVSEAA